MNEPVATEPSGLERVWAIWRRRKWLALGAFLAPLTVVLSVAAFLPEIYKSTATVLVDRQQVPEAFVQSTVTSALETRLQTISQETLSRGRLQELINRFGLYGALRGRMSEEALIERMRSDIEVRLQSVHQSGRGGATVAFTIGYRGRDPQTVATVTNTVASFYVAENLRLRERAAAGTAEFLRTQLEATKLRLDEQERQVSEFKRRHLGELPEQLAANLATLERLNTQLRVNSDSQSRALERRRLAQQLAESGVGAGLTEGMAAGEARVVRLRRELEALRGRYTEKHPDVMQTRAEIARLEAELPRDEVGQAARGDGSGASALSDQARLRQALAEMETELRALQSEERSLRAAIGEYQKRVENTPRREQEYQEVARDYQSTRDLYGRLLKRSEEAQLAETLEQRQKGEQFRVLEPAIPAERPASPNLPRLAIVGLLMSLGVAVGAVWLAERLDLSYHSVDELRAAVALPVVAKIPLIVTPADARRQKRLALAGAGAGVLGLLVLVGAAYLLAHGNERLVWILMARSF